MKPSSFTYRHDYTQTLTYKIFLARKSRPDEFISFVQALGIIRQVHRLTRGIPQIVYLVGWQYDGHDSRYPCWAQVNHRLGRGEDADATESLRWLMREAATLQATVSLHINMCDAYPDSPLWDEYVQKDLLNRNPDGSLMLGGIWDGVQSYLVSKTREWQAGLAKRRIDALVEMLPLAQAGMIHIDVFRPCPSPFHNMGLEFAADFADTFYTRTLPWHFLNRHTILRHVHTADSYEVHFADDVRTVVRKNDRRFHLWQGDRLLAENTDLLLPAPWAGQECVAYSRQGGRRTWEMPPDWKSVTRVELEDLTPTAVRRLAPQSVTKGLITLDLQPRQAVCVRPATSHL